MIAWHWLALVLALVGLLTPLYGLDRLGLWLEARGWLHYRHRKPTSSPASAWVAWQQFLEPGARHIREVCEELPAEGDEEAGRRWPAASLRAALGATAVNLEEVHSLLALAKRGGLDWERLYEEAVQEQVLARPDRTGLLPLAGAVAPPAHQQPDH
jgi:hypothetical protein